MINPRDTNKISYNQSESKDTMILYVVMGVFNNASDSLRV